MSKKRTIGWRSLSAIFMTSLLSSCVGPTALAKPQPVISADNAYDMSLEEAGTAILTERSRQIDEARQFLKNYDYTKSQDMLILDRDQIELLRQVRGIKGLSTETIDVLQNYAEIQLGESFSKWTVGLFMAPGYEEYAAQNSCRKNILRLKRLCVVHLGKGDEEYAGQTTYGRTFPNYTPDNKAPSVDLDISEDEWFQHILWHEIFHSIDPGYRWDKKSYYLKSGDAEKIAEYVELDHKTEFYADLGAALMTYKLGDTDNFEKIAKIRILTSFFKGHEFAHGEINPSDEDDDPKRINLTGQKSLYGGTTYQLYNVKRAMDEILSVYGKEYLQTASVKDLESIARHWTDKYAYNAEEAMELSAFFETGVTVDDNQIKREYVNDTARNFYEDVKPILDDIVKMKRKSGRKISSITPTYNEDQFTRELCTRFNGYTGFERLVQTGAYLDALRDEFHNGDAPNYEHRLGLREKIRFVQRNWVDEKGGFAAYKCTTTIAMATPQVH